jgi:hypothetical protein
VTTICIRARMICTSAVSAERRQAPQSEKARVVPEVPRTQAAKQHMRP